MEKWLLLGILSYLSYAISTSIDKHLMNKEYDPANTNTLKMFFDGLILLIIGFLFFNLNFTFELFSWSLILGGLYAISGILYFTSLKLEDVGIIIPYLQSSGILLIFISSTIIFNEIVNIFNYIGIALILIGVYAVLSENGFKIPKLNKAVFLVLTIVILHTIYALLTKNLLFKIEPINLAIMMYFSSAMFLAGYLALFKRQKKLHNINGSKIIVAAFFGAMGTFLLYSALAVGNASKVYPIAGIESVFVFILASIALKEKFYWHRVAGTIIVFLGIFLISL